uniref:N6-adenine methyltransferase n=1 Tax=Favella ehrenbergii TaxID=182087 RepID=A0A7S3I0D0_9SPIT
MNQYWYSKPTIEFMAREVEQQCGNEGDGCAFLSTPSIYFSLKDKGVKARSKCLDFDTAFNKDPNYVFYDFNRPEDLPEELCGTFHMVVIDPPFITREVWEKYTAAAKRLLRPQGGIILGSTIDENEAFMGELLGCAKKQFRPSIPNLVYQYSLYANYESEGLENPNPEIPPMD